MPGSVLTDRPIAFETDAGPLAAAAEAALLGAACAIVASLPAAIRASGGGVGLPGAWLGAAGLVAVPAAISVALGRAARRGFVELTEGHAGALAGGLAIWVAIVTPVYVVLGTVLEATTHHRALGGATFGALALFVALASALVAWRIVAFATDLVTRTASRRTGVVSAALVLFALALATPVGRIIVATGLGFSTLSPAAQAAVIDAAVALGAVTAAVVVDLRAIPSRAVAVAGPAALALLVAAGLLVVGRSEPLQRALVARTALAGPMARSLGWGEGAGLEGTPRAP